MMSQNKLPPATSPLLQVEDLRVSFAGKTVVDGASFAIDAHEKFALVGESGSGKSVTALSLLGLLPDATVGGRALFHAPSGDCDLFSLPERDLRRLRGSDIAMIFQEPMTALNPLMTVGRQIAEVVCLKQALSLTQGMQSAVELLAKTGIPEPARRAQALPHQLSGGQRQRVMIAMALACQPRLLIADEPTTALDASLRLQILALLDQLQQETGMGVLLITHDLNMVRRFAHRVAVMQQGRLVEVGLTTTIFDSPRHAYTKKLMASAPVRDVREDALQIAAAPIVNAEALRVTYPVPLPGIKGWFKKGEFVALQSSTVRLLPGCTVGVIGESGSGKSTLAQAVLGLLPAAQVSGALHINQSSWCFKARADRGLRRVIQVVFQDPFSSLSPRMTIAEIIAEGLQVHFPERSAVENDRAVRQALADVGLGDREFPGLLARYPHEFSGGQRQRIALARALVVEPQVLVLDEPTSALDVTIQKQVLALLQKFQRERGLAYLLITHDVAVVRAMAHEVMVFKDGHVLEQGEMGSVLDHPRHAYTRDLVAAAEPLPA